MANGIKRDGEDHKGRMGEGDELTSVRIVLSLLRQSVHNFAIGFLRCRCCRWLRLNLRICSFMVVHQSRRRVKRTITTDLPITRMLET